LGGVLALVDDGNGDDVLDAGETWTYTYTYTVTQDDVDANWQLVNTITVDSDETHSQQAVSIIAVDNDFDGQPFLTKSVSEWSALFGPTSGGILLGDDNHNGLADDGLDLFISNATADAILASSGTSADVRVKILGEAIAAQLNSNSGINLPNDILDEAISWLTGKGAWSGLGVNLDTNNDKVLDNGFKIAKDGTFSFNGTAVKETSAAWTKLVDVIQNPDLAGSEWDDSASLAGNQEANGADLFFALHAFNTDQLVTTPTQVGWSGTGTPPPVGVTDNVADAFWVLLHNEAGL